jgi:hypothetical protein
LVNRVAAIVRETRIGAAAIVASIVSPAIVVARIIPINRAVDGSGIVQRLRPRRSKGSARIVGMVVVASIYAGAVDREIAIVGALSGSMTFTDGQRPYRRPRISSYFTSVRAAAIT